jgi:hypothetical protein
MLASMAPRWVLDESGRPLLVIRLDDQSGREPPDFESLLAALGRAIALAREETIQLLLDLTGASPNAERRRRLADWLRRDAWEVRDRVSAFAVVAPNPFLRGTITAMRWFFPEKMLYTETFDSAESAIAWIRSRRR